MSNVENPISLRFHFYSLRFGPYANDTSRSHNHILNEVITYLSQQIQNGKGHLIDRHHGRTTEEPRELFLTSAVFMHKERRIRCSLALLRAGRQPMLKPADKFKLIPLDKGTASIAEQTHFYIDFSKDFSVICMEFNSHGPRISDIEYYLRNVAHQTLRISKETDVNLFMDTSIEKTLKDLKNVLNMDIKIQPQKITAMDKDIVGEYFSAMSQFGNKIKPRFIKMEASFHTPGQPIKSSQLNNDANKMFKFLLQRFQDRPFNIDCFDNFVVKYENKDGMEDVFNLLNGKKEIIKEVDPKSLSSVRKIYELIEEDFDDFMKTIK